ncbi:MAG: heat-inducible transcription repressor HrcA [Ruminococcaceae bacterium]|nr:heat-inducible transcription repressor HrcA [Oscillospiraceae bacterium]
MGIEFSDLSERKKLILKAIIDAHIRGGEPVGSKYLTQNLPISISSATIRNEMSELEEMGLLEQPHTSAGRVPSEYGYRFYVDSLMRSYEMTMNELQELNRLTKSKVERLDEILEGAAQVMGNLTNYTALAFKGRRAATVITQFKTMRMGIGKFLLVMMTSNDNVQTKVINHSFEVSDETLERLELVLNRYLCSVNLEAVTLSVISEMERAVGYEAAPLISPIVKGVYDVINQNSEEELKFAGVDRLLQYPEFSDVGKFRQLLGAIEKKDDILDLVSHSKKDEINVYIGSENSVDVMNNSTLIFRTITQNDKVVGAIGVIGPCRMDYSKVIATIDYLSKNIQQMMNNDNKLLPESEDKQ